MAEKTITDERLVTVLRFVSMDIALPFYEVMGLMLPDKPAFQILARHCILAVRAELGEQTPQGPIAEWIGKAIADRLGDEIRDRFFEWAVCTFFDSPQDHPHSLVWQFVLSRCAANPSRWHDLSLPNSRTEALRLEYREEVNDRDISELQKQQQKELLSDWDKDMYDTHGFDEDVMDPYDWFANTAARNRFQRALANLVSDLNLSEVETFRASVNYIALEGGITTITELKGPHDLNEPAY